MSPLAMSASALVLSLGADNPSTQAAVMAWQRYNPNLKADGVYGPSSAAQMQKDLAPSPAPGAYFGAKGAVAPLKPAAPGFAGLQATTVVPYEPPTPAGLSLWEQATAGLSKVNRATTGESVLNRAATELATAWTDFKTT